MIRSHPFLRQGVGLAADRIGRPPTRRDHDADPGQDRGDRALAVTIEVVLIADRQHVDAVLGEEVAPTFVLGLE
jgi:hypothetical protein